MIAIGVATELTQLQTSTEQNSTTLITTSRKRFDDLYDSLQGKILSLLPSAGAAGLSTTYYDAKSRYAPTSYAGKPGAPILHGWKGWIRRGFGYNPASVVATIFFYLLFLAPLGFIVYQSVALLLKMENQHFVPDPKMLAVRFLIVIPLATLSGFGLLSLRSYRRLYEVYNHKQRVMELYQSFGREVAENGDEDQKKKLLEIMLDSVASKPWDQSEKAQVDGEGGAVKLVERLIDDLAKVKALGS